MNLLALAQRLWSESGRLGAGPTGVTGLQGDQLRAVNAVRDAWRTLQMETAKHRWKWMRRTVTKPLTASVITYTAAGWSLTDFGRWWPETTDYMPEVLDAAGNRMARLCWLPYETFRETHMVYDNPGLPDAWSTAPNGDLLVGAKPSGADWQLRVDYLTEPTELTAASDAPNMPAKHHMLLVWMALEQLASSDENAPMKMRARDNRRTDKALLMNEQADNPSLYHMEPLA